MGFCYDVELNILSWIDSIILIYSDSDLRKFSFVLYLYLFLDIHNIYCNFISYILLAFAYVDLCMKVPDITAGTYNYYKKKTESDNHQLLSNP